MRLAPLCRTKVAQAYPLIQAMRPDLSLEGWCALATEHLRPAASADHGILTVETEQGYILGLIFYTIYTDLKHGRTLLAKDALVLAPVRQSTEAAFALLIEGVEQVAAECDCRAIHTSLLLDLPQRGNRALRDSLTSRGHRMDHFMFCKTLPEGTEPLWLGRRESAAGDLPRRH
ncbi:MAG: hypothetical protein QNJ94_19645 [Alphaproteobacteria bacterium]|nr:hypothetical protein [Alphaproteobacteria bacterium]